MKRPEVSVIVPVYNACGFLRRCVESVLTQAEIEVELVLVDDGSNDDSGDLCDALASGDGRIRVVHQANGGVSAARNAGMAHANGEWITFLDADDILLPGALAALIACSNGGDAVGGGVIRGVEAREPDGLNCHVYRTPEERQGAFRMALEDPTRYLTTHGWLIRTQLLQETKLTFRVDLCYGEDSEFMVRLLPRCGGIVMANRLVYGYTINRDSALHRYRSDTAADYLRAIDAVTLALANKQELADSVSLYTLTHLLLILVHCTFHPANPAGVRGSWQQARTLLQEPKFVRALAEAPLKRLGMGRRLVLWTLRHGMILPAWAAARWRQRQNIRHA